MFNPLMIKCVPDILVFMSHLAVVVTTAQLLLDEREKEGNVKSPYIGILQDPQSCHKAFKLHQQIFNYNLSIRLAQTGKNNVILYFIDIN